MDGTFGVILGVVVAGFIFWKVNTSPEAQQARDRALEQQKRIVCPHCNSTGTVTARQIKRKKGISGGKATGAIITGGASVVATGLSRKEGATQMSCSNCGTTWDV